MQGQLLPEHRVRTLLDTPVQRNMLRHSLVQLQSHPKTRQSTTSGHYTLRMAHTHTMPRGLRAANLRIQIDLRRRLLGCSEALLTTPTQGSDGTPTGLEPNRAPAQTHDGGRRLGTSPRIGHHFPRSLANRGPNVQAGP